MSDNSKKEKVSFRVEWNFESGSEEAIAIEYINQLGAKKKSEVINALKLFFYPKAVYSGGIEANEVQLRLCRDLIIQLEQQALYLRRLLDLPGNVVRNDSAPTGTQSVRSDTVPEGCKVSEGRWLRHLTFAKQKHSLAFASAWRTSAVQEACL